MGKAIPCRVILHGSFKEHDGGTFDSVTEAKKMTDHWCGPRTIIRLNK